MNVNNLRRSDSSSSTDSESGSRRSTISAGRSDSAKVSTSPPPMPGVNSPASGQMQATPSLIDHQGSAVSQHGVAQGVITQSDQPVVRRKTTVARPSRKPRRETNAMPASRRDNRQPATPDELNKIFNSMRQHNLEDQANGGATGGVVVDPEAEFDPELAEALRISLAMYEENEGRWDSVGRNNTAAATGAVGRGDHAIAGRDEAIQRAISRSRQSPANNEGDEEWQYLLDPSAISLMEQELMQHEVDDMLQSLEQPSANQRGTIDDSLLREAAAALINTGHTSQATVLLTAMSSSSGPGASSEHAVNPADRRGGSQQQASLRAKSNPLAPRADDNAGEVHRPDGARAMGAAAKVQDQDSSTSGDEGGSPPKRHRIRNWLKNLFFGRKDRQQQPAQGATATSNRATQQSRETQGAGHEGENTRARPPQPATPINLPPASAGNSDALIRQTAIALLNSGRLELAHRLLLQYTPGAAAGASTQGSTAGSDPNAHSPVDGAAAPSHSLSSPAASAGSLFLTDAEEFEQPGELDRNSPFRRGRFFNRRGKPGGADGAAGGANGKGPARS